MPPGLQRPLPQYVTRFIGREQEQNDILQLLEQARVLTLTGAGGSGKTRLASRLAARASDRFPDGVSWVELATISAPGLVASTLAQALGLRPFPGQTELDVVVSHLESRRALVVLDNCEHLLDEAARVAEVLGRRCPHQTTLATSREPLRAEGEIEWRVPCLSLPSGVKAEASEGSDAVRLFVDRATQVRPDFTLTAENGPGVVRICRQVDGIPLAIELAAARLRAFSIDQIADGLSDCFHLLTSGRRTALPRHQTLRASVDWSHDLLSDDERVTFRRLAVFTGGFTLQAAESVCASEGVDRRDVLSLLAALVEKSLVQADGNDSVVRYRLLETIRQYALERLDEAGETKEARDRHCEFFVDLAESI